MPQMPNVSSVFENAPMADYGLVSFFGVFAPAGVPEPIMERLHTVITTAEAEKFGRIVEDARITVEG